MRCSELSPCFHLDPQRQPPAFGFGASAPAVLRGLSMPAGIALRAPQRGDLSLRLSWHLLPPPPCRPPCRCRAMLMSAAALTLRAACGSRSRSTRIRGRRAWGR